MDPERRRWLEEAISGMSVDVVKQLAEAIRILGGPASFDAGADEDELEEIEMAFEAVEDWCGNIDMANNFHKIQGFEVLNKILRESPHPSVRANAANAVAEMAQNNPYCQENFLADGFLPLLLGLMEKDRAERVRLKSLYAISSIVRDYPPGIKAFLDKNGADGLLRTIQDSDNSPRLRTKACFFVASVAEGGDSEMGPEVKRVLYQMGFARQLVALLQTEEWDLSLHEQAARGLCVLVRNNPELQKELVNSKELEFGSLLDRKLGDLADKGEAQDERQHFKEMKDSCFGKTTAAKDDSVYR